MLMVSLFSINYTVPWTWWYVEAENLPVYTKLTGPHSCVHRCVLYIFVTVQKSLFPWWKTRCEERNNDTHCATVGCFGAWGEWCHISFHTHTHPQFHTSSSPQPHTHIHTNTAWDFNQRAVLLVLTRPGVYLASVCVSNQGWEEVVTERMYQLSRLIGLYSTVAKTISPTTDCNLTAPDVIH